MLFFLTNSLNLTVLFDKTWIYDKL